MTNQLPPEVYATLAGNVDTQMVQRVFTAFSTAINDGVQTVHLLIQSTGGFVGDGVGLYNYIRNLPVNVVAYNGGSVLSIAVIAYLGAKHRKASQTASFLIHKSQSTTQAGAGSGALQLAADNLAADDRLTEEILKQHIKMPDSKWELHGRSDLHITADEALEYGLVHELADFIVPNGAKLFNI
jgi:ATP-dependent Clp protease protease subunit